MGIGHISVTRAFGAEERSIAGAQHLFQLEVMQGGSAPAKSMPGTRDGDQYEVAPRSRGTRKTGDDFGDGGIQAGGGQDANGRSPPRPLS